MTSDTDDIAQRGMSLFQFQIRDALHWIVRDQPVSDYGIDAHIELKDGDVATGRLLAFQVKSSTNGRTGYFDEPRNEGWTYRPTDRHVKYWLAHSLPVFVALIDLETRSIYWRAIDSTNLSRSRRGGWKVHVPNHNTLTNARTQWELAADRLYHDAHLRFIDHIEVLPPTASEILVEMRSSGDTSASDLLAAHLAVGRREPALVLETLLQNSPNWMNEVGAAWKTVGAYADAHQLPESAAEGYLRASRLLPSERAMLKNWAAFELIQVQRVQALSLFDEAARENGGLLSELGRAICLSFDSSRSDLDLGDPTLQARLELADEDEGFIIATFLAAQAASQNHWNRSVDLLRRVRERRPWSATLLSRLSFTLALRAQSEQSQAGDIAEATEVAQLAVSNYRKWNGPTTEILAHLLGLLANAREWEQILRSATAAPTGQATDTEAARPFVMSMAATAAHELGEESLRDSLLNSLPDGPDKAFEAAKRITEGLNPKLPEAIEQWESVLGALDDARPVQILHAVSMLAHGGVDRSERLIPLTESGAIAARERDLAAAIALFHSDPSEALPRLRVLADSTPRAAKALCMLLADQHGRAQEAIQTCKNAADRFQDPVFRLMEVDLLLAEGDTGSAKDAAELALSSPGISAVHAAAAHHFLAQIAGGDEDWPGVIRHTSAAVSSRRRAEHDEVWWLITAHLRQDRDDLAFETVRRFRPMPTNRIQVRLWLRAVHYGDIDPEIASQIVQLAIQFENDTELAAALLTEILLGTRDEAATEGANPLDSRSPVPMSTRQQAFAALARHTELHGANSPIRVISIPEDAEGIVETLSQFLRAGNRRSSASAVEEIRRSNVPLGLLSEITGHTYAFTLARRDLGMYFSCFASGADADADADAAAAASASSGDVVVDASALLVASLLGSLDRIRGRFSRLLLPASSSIDIRRARTEATGMTSSSGWLGWNELSDEPAFLEPDYAHQVETLRRLSLLERAARGPQIVSGDLPEFHGLVGDHLRPWLDPLQLAVSRQIPLWSDDGALRRLARTIGVATFDTVSMQEHLASEALASDIVDLETVDSEIERRHAEVRLAMQERVVDWIATIDDLLRLAREERYPSSLAYASVGRAAWWSGPTPIEDLRQVFRRVSEHSSEAAVEWHKAAMLGIVDLRLEPDATASLLSIVVLLTVNDEGVSTDVRLTMRLAEQFADDFGASNPRSQLARAAGHLASLGILPEVEEIVASILTS